LTQNINKKCRHGCHDTISGPESSSQQTVTDDNIYWSDIKDNACEGKEIIDEVDIPFYCDNLEFGQDYSQYVKHCINEYKNRVNPQHDKFLLVTCDFHSFTPLFGHLLKILVHYIKNWTGKQLECF
jgi:hypothetical protein